MIPEARLDGGALARRLSAARGARVVVLGDLIADEYVYGNTSRVSREAPVLILTFDRDQVVPGGAGNAAHNLRTLGADVRPVGVVGRDAMGRALLEFFEMWRISRDGVVVAPDRPTTTKTRIMAGDFHTARQQVIRVDREAAAPLPAAVRARLGMALRRAAAKADGFLISDYGYGAADPSLARPALASARRRGTPSVADSRYRLPEFLGASVVTPNESEIPIEAGRAQGPPLRTTIPGTSPGSSYAVRATTPGSLPGSGYEVRADLLRVGRRLLGRLGARGVLITRGRDGMLGVERGGAAWRLPIVGSAEAVDVTGAGDTVAAAVTLALAAGGTLVEAAGLATYAASLKVQKRGTAAVSAAEVAALLDVGRGERGPAPPVRGPGNGE